MRHAIGYHCRFRPKATLTVAPARHHTSCGSVRRNAVASVTATAACQTG
jgi:hypothetical protein